MTSAQSPMTAPARVPRAVLTALGFILVTCAVLAIVFLATDETAPSLTAPTQLASVKTTQTLRWRSRHIPTQLDFRGMQQYADNLDLSIEDAKGMTDMPETELASSGIEKWKQFMGLAKVPPGETLSLPDCTIRGESVELSLGGVKASFFKMPAQKSCTNKLICNKVPACKSQLPKIGGVVKCKNADVTIETAGWWHQDTQQCVPCGNAKALNKQKVKPNGALMACGITQVLLGPLLNPVFGVGKEVSKGFQAAGKSAKKFFNGADKSVKQAFNSVGKGFKKAGKGFKKAGKGFKKAGKGFKKGFKSVKKGWRM